MLNYLKFVVLIAIAFAVLLPIFWLLDRHKKKTRHRLAVGVMAILGAIMLASGLHRHLSGDDSMRAGGKYGPRAWFQDVGAGAALLLAAALGHLASRKDDKNA